MEKSKAHKVVEFATRPLAICNWRQWCVSVGNAKLNKRQSVAMFSDGSMVSFLDNGKPVEYLGKF